MNNAPILSFDIETVPDVAALRALHQFSASVSDNEVVDMAKRLQRQKGKSDFLPLPYHQILVISCALRYAHTNESEPFRIFSLAAPEYDEKSAIEMFYKIIDKYTPQLVSWNGGGFDLPVLHYRGLHHGVTAGRYWQMHGNDAMGEKFRFNNYLSRYHERHADLMDIMAGYAPQAWSGLDNVAQMCRLPGKIGIGGAGVYAAWQEGRLTEIIEYCEVDALLTYLLYLRLQHFRGLLSSLDEEHDIVREQLHDDKWQDFLQQWAAVQ